MPHDHDHHDQPPLPAPHGCRWEMMYPHFEWHNGHWDLHQE